MNSDLWFEGKLPLECLGSFTAWVTYLKDGRQQYLKVGFGTRALVVREAEALVAQLRERGHPDAVAYAVL